MTDKYSLNSAWVIEESDVETYKSEFGNNFIRITPSEIVALMTGKVLHYDDGEYSTFMFFSNDKEE